MVGGVFWGGVGGLREQDEADVLCFVFDIDPQAEY
jgi:hypothetical protein